MEYKTIVLPHFNKQLKVYCKKYRSLNVAILKSLKNFKKNNEVYLGDDLYKIRIGCKDISKGKSKAFRLILVIAQADNVIVPVVIYFKGDRSNISRKEINKHLNVILDELKD